MRAIIQNGYGSPELLEVKEIEKPTVSDNGVLVRVCAAGLHAGDYFLLKGTPYIVRFAAGWPKPKNYIPGFDLAGRIEEVGRKVTRFRPGDEVFAGCEHACAEYASGPESMFAPKPPNLSFEQAAVVPTSALAALHGLRDAGKIRKGQKILINGASGGVGTFAVQIGKDLGAEVTGVCSTRNVELVRSLGADHVIDYTREDFTRGDKKYDLILDNIANRSFSECRRVLAPGGKHIPNSGRAGMGYIVMAALRSAVVHQQGSPYMSKPNQEDLLLLKDLLESGGLRPVIDRTFDLSDAPKALRYVGEGHVRGKVVLAVSD